MKEYVFLVSKGRGKNRCKNEFKVTEEKDLKALGLFLINGWNVKRIKK